MPDADLPDISDQQKTRAATVPAQAGGPAEEQDLRHRPGSRGFRRTSLALFAAGMATFFLLYSTQALLPALSDSLRLTPSQASWTVSAATLGIAVAVLPVSALSEKFGRTRVMTLSVFAAALLAVVIPFAPGLTSLVVLRAVQGVCLAGLPATAMAYLAEEVHPSALPSAMGLYIAGNSIGGMGGRIVADVVGGLAGWRWGLGSVAIVSVACAVLFRMLVPKARYFRPAPVNPAALARTVLGHLRNPLLLRLFALGLLFMAVFGAVYNVMGYRLTAGPFDLPDGLVGLIFVVYLVGTFTSASAGRIVDRLGRRGALFASIGVTALGLLVSIPDSLVAALLGLVLITGGFFAGHSVASSSVGRTATAGRAQASALYLAAYYIGNSVGGTIGADAYHSHAWNGTVAVGLGVLALAAGVTGYAALRARRDRTATAV
jgi:YNFM family putative membrane transporter